MASIGLENWGPVGWGGIEQTSGTDTYHLFNPTISDTIDWSSGPNDLEGTTFARHGPRTEGKFNVTSAGVVLARTLTGCNWTDRATGGTTCQVTGSGSGTSVTGLLGTFWKSSWDLKLDVTRGTGTNRDYDCVAEADDPITMRAEDFSTAQNGRYNILIPLKLRDLGLEPTASGGWSAGFETAAGTISLLDISAGPGGVSVGGDDPDGLELYVMARPLDNPVALGFPTASRQHIEDVLTRRITGGTLGSELILGVALRNFEVPTTEIDSGGVVAKVHAGTRLTEAGTGEGDDDRYASPEG